MATEAGVTLEMVKRSENLCKIFGIPPAAVGEHADKAAVILNALYGMPLIEEKPKRSKFGNDLLASTRSAFRENSDFVFGVGRNVIMMQEFPYFYEHLSLTTAKLVDRYVDLERLVACLTILGFSTTAGAGAAVAAGAAKALEENSLKSGLKHAAGSFFGRSEILSVIQKNTGINLVD